MTCANCAALRSQVRKLELELGVRRRHGEIGAVMSAFGLTGQRAMFVLALYRGNGRPVKHEVLMDAIVTTAGPDVLRVVASKVRADSGLEIVTHPGVGYALTVQGVSRVLAALEPLELQEVRGPISDPGDVV